jgi:hypothetical protein
MSSNQQINVITANSATFTLNSVTHTGTYGISSITGEADYGGTQIILTWTPDFSYNFVTNPIVSCIINVAPSNGKAYQINVPTIYHQIPITYTIPNLVLGVIYKLSVAIVYNGVAYGYSTPQLVTQLYGKPSPPFGLQTKINAPSPDTSKASITLFWNTPVSLNLSTIIYYIVQVYVNGVLQTPNITTSVPPQGIPADTKTTINYVYYGSIYSFSVIAVTQNSNSDPSTISTPVTIPIFLPNTPNTVTASSIQGSQTATLKWVDNPLNGGTEKSHQLRINDITTGKTTTINIP